VQRTQLQARLRPHVPALVPGLALVGLMLVWAVHDGGYDAETWYWGALAALGLLAATAIVLGGSLRLHRAGAVAISLFGLYVAWSYLSITWAQSPGDALQGSNRALLYLLVFALMLLLPWTPKAALVALLTFVIGVGVIGVVLLFRLAAQSDVASLVIEGRLSAPTGYFNATAALFTVGALPAVVLATRRELPGPLRGLLLAFACTDLQLALIVQSRGWLFTLPLVLLATIALVPDRLRVVAAAIIPIVGAVVPLHRLFDVYQQASGAALTHAAGRAGQAALLICLAAFVLGTLLAWGDSLITQPSVSRAGKRAIGVTLSVIAVAGAGGTFVVATHGHPAKFIVRQWNGFSHTQVNFSSHSHFGDVGSGRYDFWRVALDAVLAHPIGGLGQDNFADYYVTHRRTNEEPSWTHSLELRLLAHTGFVGLGLFVAFLVAAGRLAYRGRRQPDGLTRAIAGAALLPLVVWLIHGSVDWFWEMPALTVPALGFLGMAGSLASSRVREQPVATASSGVADRPRTRSAQRSRRGSAERSQRRVGLGAGAVALLAGVVVLGFPYLSVREVSLASDIQATNPTAALADLSRAASLNPLDADPGRIAGTIALSNGKYRVAAQRFSQSLSAEPGGWFGWLGAGLAASALGDPERAHRDFEIAASINRQQPAVTQALARVHSKYPLTSAQAFKLLVVVQ
jgi:O-Antigen ligase